MHRHWVRVLLVEDDEDDFVLARTLLEGSVDPLIELDWAPTLAVAKAAIARGEHHLYLVDYSLGAEDGISLIRHARACGCLQPMFLLTGMVDRRIDLAATAAGASGFLLKHEMTVSLLERTIRYALGHGATGYHVTAPPSESSPYAARSLVGSSLPSYRAGNVAAPAPALWRAG